MAEPQARPAPDDEPEEAGGANDATLAGTHEPAFPQLDADVTEDADDE